MSKTVWTLASIAAGLALSWTAWLVLREPSAPVRPGVLADEPLEDPEPIPEPPAELAVQAPAPQLARTAVAVPATAEVRTSLIVRDRAGQPIEGVGLRAPGAEQPLGTTDAGGRCVLGGELFALSRGPIPAVAEHEDFLPAELELLEGEDDELVLARKPRVEIELVEPGGGRPAGPSSAKVWVREASSGAVVDIWAEPDGGTLAAVRLPVGRLERAEGRARGFAPGSAAFDIPLEPDTTARLRLELEEGIQLEGRVIDAATREPIPNALVWTEDMFFDEDSAVDRDTTDAGGRFELHGVRKNHVSVSEENPGRFWWVSIGTRAEGYEEKPWHVVGLPVSEDGRCTTEIELARASASLRCDVVGAVGPQGLLVWAVQRDGALLQDSGSGDFEFTELTPGELFLFVCNSHAEGEPFVCGRARVELEAGEQAHVEVTLEEGTGTLSGRVIDVAGNPIEGAEVRANLIATLGWIAFGAYDWTAHSGADGRFAFSGLPSGDYDVELSDLPAGLCALEGHWKPELQVGGAATGGELVASECTSVDGWVELGSLDPATLRVRACGPEGHDPHTLRFDLDAESPVAADATFRLTGLPSVETEVVLLQGDRELCRVPVGAHGARGVVLRPGP